MKITVRSPNWVGDAILSTPALTALRKKYPGAHISLFARKTVADCFLNNPAINEIISLPGKNNLSYWLRAFDLRKRKYDKAILFPNSFSSALFFRIAGIKEIIGYGKDGRGFLLTKTLKPLLKGHQADYYLNLINDSAESTELVWVATQKEKEDARKLLEGNGIQRKDRLVGISPGAAFGPAKKWHPEKFAQVGDRLVEKHSAKILLFGRDTEESITAEITRYMKNRSINLAGRTNLRQLGTLLSMCKLLITNDSGAMHIAAAVKTPVVGIFGSTDPAKTGPRGKCHTVIYNKLSCSPCFSTTCPYGHYKCLREINVMDVLLASDKQLTAQEHQEVCETPKGA